MNNKIFEIIWQPYNAEILEICDGEHSISDIQRKIGLTYKSIFNRLKNLEKEGLIERTNKPHEISKPIISKKNKQIITPLVQNILVKQKILFEQIKTKSKKESVNKILNFLNKTRYVDQRTFFRSFNFIEEKDIILLFNLLKDSCFIKERYELTKKGKNFIKGKSL